MTVFGVRRRGDEVAVDAGETRTADLQGRATFLLLDTTTHGQPAGWRGIGWRFRVDTGQGVVWSHEVAEEEAEAWLPGAFGFPPRPSEHALAIPFGLVRATVTLTVAGDAAAGCTVEVYSCRRAADGEAEAWPPPEFGFPPRPSEHALAIPFGLVRATVTLTVAGDPVQGGTLEAYACRRAPDGGERLDRLASETTDEAGQVRFELWSDRQAWLPEGAAFAGYRFKAEVHDRWFWSNEDGPEVWLPEGGGFPAEADGYDFAIPIGLVETNVTLRLRDDPLPDAWLGIYYLRRDADGGVGRVAGPWGYTDELGRRTFTVWSDRQRWEPAGATHLGYEFLTWFGLERQWSSEYGPEVYVPPEGGYPAEPDAYDFVIPYGYVATTVRWTLSGDPAAGMNTALEGVLGWSDGSSGRGGGASARLDDDGRATLRHFDDPTPILPEGGSFQRWRLKLDTSVGPVYASQAGLEEYVPPQGGYPPVPSEVEVAFPSGLVRTTITWTIGGDPVPGAGIHVWGIYLSPGGGLVGHSRDDRTTDGQGQAVVEQQDAPDVYRPPEFGWPSKPNDYAFDVP